MPRTGTVIWLALTSTFLFLLFPNLLWLANSTARVTNGESESIGPVMIHVDDKTVELGILDPEEKRFLLLPKSGDSTYSVTYQKGADSISVCSAYIEGEMYHVQTVLNGPTHSRCEVSLPLLSDLLVLKML